LGGTPPPPPASTINLRTNCAQGASAYDLGINNVRARLLICGDAWWDLDGTARYVVPNVELGSGVPEVSSMFAGAIWLGGKDPSGNLKLAAQTYRSATRNDFWPGPLDTLGEVTEETCQDWDKHFVVNGNSIRQFIAAFELSVAAGTPFDCGLIPEDVKGWPAKGNPFFFEINQFELPNTDQGLALFFDRDGDDKYDPCKGDYPVIDIRGCELKDYPDQMIFWIYNDNGNVHTQAQGSSPIRMEIQVQAFAYVTNDQLNDMTFMRYKLINRSVEVLDSTFFAVWSDPDLGCALDDYIGCDTTRSLAICYNQDNIDGNNGSSCDQGTPTYGENIPMIGVDYFRGPRDTDKPILDPITGLPVLDPFTGQIEYEEIGMTSFTYYANGGFPGFPGTSDPQSAQQYYNYMTGKWSDGTPVTFGGNGYNQGSSDLISYVYVGEPDNQNAWTMCSENLAGFDGRTVQASGPFRLAPGAVNELIIGLPWVADQNYPCPTFDDIFEADDISQALFDNCFDITDGPDAPCLSFLELDREIVVALSNDPTSNNYKQEYEELDLGAPTTQPDTTYQFEGYIVYQLRDPSVTRANFNDPELARIVYQADVKNNIATIYNWDGVDVGLSQAAFVPEAMVQGGDKGIRNTFNLTDDQFADGDQRRLINHRKYYYVAIAYAYNNWKQFDPADGSGQAKPYLVGRNNIGDGTAQYYTVMPRPITDRVVNASYGPDNVVITRWEGVGTDKNFLDVSNETRESWLNGPIDGKITYLAGKGPITINIYNPLDVKNGEFELTFIDGDMTDSKVADDAKWELTELASGAVVVSAASIESLNEQLLSQYGFSVSIAHGVDPGTDPFNELTNGFIGATAEYFENKAEWLATFTDGPNVAHFMQTLESEPLFEADPERVFAAESNLFVPYQLCGWTPAPNQPMLYSPAWINSNNDLANDAAAGLKNLNNVDIVLTRDKSKWSRCVVVETSNPYATEDLVLATIGGAKNFDLRKAPSVGKDDANGDGLPDPDGALETFSPLVGQPLEGMGWFPGYAVDVETGQRLNIFFGEASVYGIHNFAGFEDQPIYSLMQNNTEGLDMMWNPSATLQLGAQLDPIFDFFGGGQQYVYVTDQPYDGCDSLRTRLDPKFGPSPFRKIAAIKRITWTAVPFSVFGQRMLSYADGLIPNEMVIKMRVENSYKTMATPSSVNNSYPTYRIKLDGVEASPLTASGIETQLDRIGVVPNPYYGYSAYEVTQFNNVVKITNLPPKCKITIYSLDGKFIRQYDRNEAADNAACLEPAIDSRQIFPDLDWDLKNTQSIPVASGVYLIHVDAPGLGERVIKWFGTNRRFDPSGL
jgi:hypothetical protein